VSLLCGCFWVVGGGTTGSGRFRAGIAGVSARNWSIDSKPTSCQLPKLINGYMYRYINHCSASEIMGAWWSKQGYGFIKGIDQKEFQRLQPLRF